MQVLHPAQQSWAADWNEGFPQIDQIGVGGLGKIAFQQGEIQGSIVNLGQQIRGIFDRYCKRQIRPSAKQLCKRIRQKKAACRQSGSQAEW